MFKKIKKLAISHKVISCLIIAALLGGGYFAYKKIANNDGQTRYVLAAVEKGTLVNSVTATGQAASLDQAEVKAKASGEIIKLWVVQDQAVKSGQILAEIDSQSAKRAVSEAEIALESAKIKLDDLLAPPTEEDLWQAENDLAQAQSDLSRAAKAEQNIQEDVEDVLQSAHNDGYSDVSTSFSKLSLAMRDLQDALGTSKNEQEYVGAYQIILGQNSPFIQGLILDEQSAAELYDDNVVFLGTVFQSDERAIVYKLISDTLQTSQAISKALESARHMYDAIATAGYSQYAISATIEKMRPKIESDLSAIFSIVSSLRKAQEVIDQTSEDMPDKISDAKLALQTAKLRLLEKEKVLQDLKDGADELDVKIQQNLLAQKELALQDVQDQLDGCFVKSPFAGQVAEIDIKKGDEVSIGSIIATLIAQQKVAEITLNEIDIAKVKTGQKATITFDALEDFTATGQVSEVETIGQASQGVVNYKVVIDLDVQDEAIKPGMSLTAAIIVETKSDVLMVANSAIKSSGENYYVETLPNLPSANSVDALASVNQAGVASALPPKQVQVEIGLANDAMTEITNGLQEGDQIITRTISSSAAAASQTSGSGLFQTQRTSGGGGAGVMMMPR